jgi:hypothetical protein
MNRGNKVGQASRLPGKRVRTSVAQASSLVRLPKPPATAPP